MTQEEWYTILDKMIYAMDKIANDEHYAVYVEEYNRIQEGCKLFGKWFLHLWW